MTGLSGVEANIESKKAAMTDLTSEEEETRHAKYLLMRLRNEEVNLRKSAFERDDKGFDNYLFEANSSQHRLGIKME